MKEDTFKIKLIQKEGICKLVINDIELENIIEKYQIIKEGGEPSKLIIQIPLINEDIKVESYIN